MTSALVLLLLGGFLLGGAWSAWSVDEDSPRGTPQLVAAGVLLVSALLATAAGILRFF